MRECFHGAHLAFRCVQQTLMQLKPPVDVNDREQCQLWDTSLKHKGTSHVTHLHSLNIQTLTGVLFLSKDSWGADRDLHGWGDVFLCGEKS